MKCGLWKRNDQIITKTHNRFKAKYKGAGVNSLQYQQPMPNRLYTTCKCNSSCVLTRSLTTVPDHNTQHMCIKDSWRFSSDVGVKKKPALWQPSEIKAQSKLPYVVTPSQTEKFRTLS